MSPIFILSPLVAGAGLCAWLVGKWRDSDFLNFAGKMLIAVSACLALVGYGFGA